MSDRLEQIPFFKDLSQEELQRLEDVMPMRRYVGRQIIFMEGEPADFVGFVLSGRVKLYRMSAEGHEKVIHIAGAGDVFGEVPFLDGKPHPLTAETMEETRVRSISHEDLRQLMAVHPQVASHLLQVLGLRLRQTYRQIRSLVFKDAYARTAGRLFKLARDYGVQTGDGITLNLTITHQELANMVGTSRETVSKIINSLQKNRTIDVCRGRIVIFDMDKLRKYTREQG